MRNHWIGGGSLLAGLLLVLGLVSVAGHDRTPAVQAQTAECPEDQDMVRCLTIVKETDPAGEDQDFSFEYSQDGSGSSISLGDGDQASFELVDGETLVVTESDVDGWSLTGISCSGEGLSIENNLSDGSVTVSVTAGATVDASGMCTFANAMDDEATPAPTATGTPPAATATPSRSPATSTPQPTAEAGGETISPPATGSGGMKR